MATSLPKTNERMNDCIVVSVDGACSEKRAACAAVLSVGGRIVAEKSRAAPDAEGYVLAAEIAGVALAAALIEGADTGDRPVIIEVDNPMIPRVLRGDYRPPGFHRIPQELLEQAGAICWRPLLRFRVLRRNSTPGLRYTHRLASRRLWAKRRSRSVAR